MRAYKPVNGNDLCSTHGMVEAASQAVTPDGTQEKHQEIRKNSFQKT
jgi:hypothetical protein